MSYVNLIDLDNLCLEVQHCKLKQQQQQQNNNNSNSNNNISYVKPISITKSCVAVHLYHHSM